ncbi:MAG: MATE family efflux transporter [Alphaproteobacteria bacterium]|nr:MATE family efflux transporter [Alphaproteobacteria bacterium]
MSDLETKITPAWLRERLTRHFSELARLALPAVMMRIGIFGLAMVDTFMVIRYSEVHLAWLNLANQSIIMFALVVGLGLLGGITVYVANAIGADDTREAGRVWRRNMPFALSVGIALAAVIWPAEFWFTLLGQTPEKAFEGGKLVQILALGIPGHMLFVCCVSFLEGIKRAEVGFYLMVGANIVNLILNYMLIFGNWGAPELGAAGSAWASTGVRWFMAIAAIGYVWLAPSVRGYGVRIPHGQKWSDWRDQRQMGYASAVSLATEVLAFGALAIFAGWLGTLPLAAHGLVFQIVGVPLMISIGIGVASSVRVGIAYARNDKADTALAGLSGIILNFVLTGAFAIFIYFYIEPLLNLITDKQHVIAILIPPVAVYALAMVMDASQMVASMILRGYKETWWPTYLQGFAFVVVMLPACYIMAFPVGHGWAGLMEGMGIGVTTSWVLQIARFRYLAKTRL